MKTTYRKQRTKTTPLPDGGKVESWKQDRNYTTVRKDAEGNQVGNAEIDGTIGDRNLSHRMLVREALKQINQK